MKSPTPKQIAKHFRAMVFGGNATGVCMKEVLEDVNWLQATTSVHKLNTIHILVFHIHYYIAVIKDVLQGKPLSAHDKQSFDAPPINSEEAWQQFLTRVYADVEATTLLIETLPEEKLWDVFVKENYGNYYRNLHGVIEHSHYHLGQISLISKILTRKAQDGK
ncbi:DUF1572 domain-containing protein [Lentiprolixibacter aurantiacus]|uniref:DUF1572 domain-containing protein n=1 Tax=Lentiprolixibacter aurantiacus TaxID=2993939 RepID=A0AAE3SNV0_9FLAO|nr:DUF1572 domain-containing protein [Lentiprolixibacter aurantiacus]MCX2720014.1 DUF1572 domain-containing protein [Lentiprolixibacter aurantiacus]